MKLTLESIDIFNIQKKARSFQTATQVHIQTCFLEFMKELNPEQSEDLVRFIKKYNEKNPPPTFSIL